MAAGQCEGCLCRVCVSVCGLEGAGRVLDRRPAAGFSLWVVCLPCGVQAHAPLPWRLLAALVSRAAAHYTAPCAASPCAGGATFSSLLPAQGSPDQLPDQLPAYATATQASDVEQLQRQVRELQQMLASQVRGRREPCMHATLHTRVRCACLRRLYCLMLEASRVCYFTFVFVFFKKSSKRVKSHILSRIYKLLRILCAGSRCGRCAC